MSILLYAHLLLRCKQNIELFVINSAAVSYLINRRIGILIGHAHFGVYKMADIKNLLKEARKLIDERNYKEAQECCKNILRKDKQNYFGLVLLGKSLQDSDQAPLAYQKAIATKRDHPLAWQGLAHYYESKNEDESKLKLIPVYNEMLSLQMEEDKLQEIITKVGQLGIALNNCEPISILATFINMTSNEKLKSSAVHQFLELLKSEISVKADDISFIQNTLAEIYKQQPNESLEILLCKILLNKTDLNLAFDEISKFSFFSSNTSLRQFLCQWLCRKFVKTMSFNELNIENFVGMISNGMEESKYSGFLKSVCLYNKGLYTDAYKLAVPLINYQETDEFEAIFIIKCAIMIRKWSVAQKLAVNFINKAKNDSVLQDLRKYLFYSLAKQEKWKQAIGNAKMLPLDIFNDEELACLAECYIEENELVEFLLEKLKPTEYYLSLQALYYTKQNKFKEVINLLQDSNNNALHSFYLGFAYWKLKEFDNCLINLLKSAKLNPDHANTFYYLGCYYYHHKEDLVKAKKCYEKAHLLHGLNSNVVKSLSETYLKLQQPHADFDLLTTFSQNAVVVEPWVHFRLGLHNLNKREWENAITNFRNVIKANQKDTTALQCLADAYYSRGSYTSALRAYNKVITLDPSKSSHCYTRIGYIHSLLTQYDQAISTFEMVIAKDPHSILPLKGISETWIRVAKKKVAAKTYGTARDCAQQSINYITLALTKRSDFTCFWKLLADTLMFITKLPDQYSFLYMSTDKTDKKKLHKIEIYEHAIACYSRIAKQSQEIASYDLAYAYYHYYQHTKLTANCHVAFNMTKACIKAKPSSWRNWNMLGKICVSLKKYELAQHCFIKALQVTKKLSGAKIWCNLGTLYLKLKLYKSANYCFWRGQSTLPSYPQSWIGQGLIAEVLREEEAMDLFRHASRLGYHPESSLGYADWVCRTLKDNKHIQDSELRYVIEGLYAIPYAMDLIEWFSNFEPNNACACNILGILQERSGLLKPAIKSYEKAFKYADDNQKNIVLLNIGRVLVRLEKYPEAVKIYKAITEASFNSTVGLALALFKNGLYEESYSVYDTALHWLCNNENEKSDLLVAMAGIVYMFKGVDDAKTILFHSIQVSQNKPSPYSLFAICSLGLTHSEQSLTKLALSELRKFEKETQYGYDIGFLKSYCSVIEDNIENAIKVLSESLHDHPSNAMLWFCMAQYSLRVSETKAKTASYCAQKALCSAQFGESQCYLANILASASIAEQLAGDKIKALTLAKEGLHMYPNQAEIWAALLLSLVSNNSWIEKKDWLIGVAGHLRRHLNISRPLSRWVGLIEKKLTVKG